MLPFLAIVFVASLTAAPRPAVAQAPAAPAPPASAPDHHHDMSTMPGHDMSQHDKPARKDATGAHDAAHMKSALGPYPMSREGSGTSWQPDATPDDGHPRDGRRLVADGAWLRQPHLRQADRPARQRQGLQPEHADADGSTPGRRRARSACARCFRSTRRRQERLSAAVPDRRDGRWRNASGRPAAPARPVHGARDFLQRAARGGRDRPSCTSACRASRRSVRRRSCIASRACAIPEAPLTHHWLDSTHITFGVATLGVSQGPFSSKVPGSTAGSPTSTAGTSRRAGSTPGRRGFRTTPARAVDAGELRRPEEPRAAGARGPGQALDRVDHLSGENGRRPVGDDARLRPQQEVGTRARRRRSLAGCSNRPM